MLYEVITLLGVLDAANAPLDVSQVWHGLCVEQILVFQDRGFQLAFQFIVQFFSFIDGVDDAFVLAFDGNAEHLAGCHGVNVQPLKEGLLEVWDRITSYNVCYTKLLRTLVGSISNPSYLPSQGSLP